MTSEALGLQSSPVINAGYYFQVLVMLGVVVALIYVIGRFLLPKLKVGGNGKLIQILDRVMIEPQVAAYVIKVGKKSWLVVAGGKNVAKIADLGEEPLA